MLLKIQKILICLFMLYNFFFRWIGYYKEIILYSFILIILLLSTVNTIKYQGISNRLFKNGIGVWFSLGIYALVFGIMIAIDRVSLFESLLKYLSSVMICYSISQIIYIEKKVGWFLKSYLFICVLCSLQIIFNGYGNNSLSLGEGNNVNYLGLFMVYGIFCLAYLYKPESLSMFDTMMVSTGIITFLYVILKTASRKSMIAAIGFIVFWLITLVADYIKTKNYRKLMLLFSFSVIVLILFSNRIIDYYSSSYAWERMTYLFIADSEANLIRFKMYSDGISMFLDSPLFGVGFDQYKFYSYYGLYSHSTYIEMLACCGLIGVILYFYPLIDIIKKLFLNYKKDFYHSSLMLLLISVQLFIGVGAILFYDLFHMIFMMSILNSSSKLMTRLAL